MHPRTTAQNVRSVEVTHVLNRKLNWILRYGIGLTFLFTIVLLTFIFLFNVSVQLKGEIVPDNLFQIKVNHKRSNQFLDSTKKEKNKLNGNFFCLIRDTTLFKPNDLVEVVVLDSSITNQKSLMGTVVGYSEELIDAKFGVVIYINSNISLVKYLNDLSRQKKIGISILSKSKSLWSLF